MAGTPRIPQFYAEQDILITGGTGFMGKGLVEKLLRSCPDVGNIYLLMRSKGKSDAATRLQKYLNEAVFDRVRKQNSKVLSKVKMVPGDITFPKLGLSPEDYEMLQENVSIIFHSAASVRFDDPIKKAFCVNVKATVEMLEFARGAKNLKDHLTVIGALRPDSEICSVSKCLSDAWLADWRPFLRVTRFIPGPPMNTKAFMHVSTAYSNCDKSEVNEVIYPALMDWKKLAVLINETEEEVLDVLTPKILGDHPNTYTFTKGLAEQVLIEYKKDIPLILFRLSIVLPALEEPFPGWVDNFNGPVGINVASGIGLVRIIYADPEVHGDHITVDSVIKGMLVAVWKKCVYGYPDEISIYNASANIQSGLTHSLMRKWGAPLVGDVAFMKCLWTCGGVTVNCKYWYYINVLLFHVLLGLFLDGCLKLSGNKPRLMKLHRIGYKANMALYPFTSKMWKFNNDRFCWLNTRVLPEDKDFGYSNFNNYNHEHHFRISLLGGRRFLFKFHDSSIPEHREHYNRIWWADQIIRQLFIMTMLWLVYKICTDIVQPKLLEMYVDIIST